MNDCQSDYIHTLNGHKGKANKIRFNPAYGIVRGPWGDEYRQEKTPTVGDLIAPGSLIETHSPRNNYVKLYRVVFVTKHGYCTCCDSDCSNRLAKHVLTNPVGENCYPLFAWSLTLIEPDTPTTRAGKYKANEDFSYDNELVCHEGRIVKLFLNNADFVTLVQSPTTWASLPPYQLQLL